MNLYSYAFRLVLFKPIVQRDFRTYIYHKCVVAKLHIKCAYLLRRIICRIEKNCMLIEPVVFEFIPDKKNMAYCSDMNHTNVKMIQIVT